MSKALKFPLLRPHASMYWELIKEIELADRDYLDRMLEEANSATPTNCWFAEYEIAQRVKKLIPAEISRREYRDKDKRKLELKEKKNV